MTTPPISAADRLSTDSWNTTRSSFSSVSASTIRAKGDPAEDPTLYLAEIDYRCLYEDISDTDAILPMIESLYAGLKEKYGEPGEECQDDILPALEAGSFDEFENNNKVFTQPVEGRDGCRYGLSVSAPRPTQIQLSVFFRLNTGI